MNAHLRRRYFYNGLIPGPSDFMDFQNDNYEALKRILGRMVTDVSRILKPSTFTLPGDYVVNVGSNAGVSGSGVKVDWDSTISFDAKQSTHGSIIGSTAPAAGQKSYIVIAVKETTTNADVRTDKFGATVYYDKQSTTQLRVYAFSTSIALADEWVVNDALGTYVADTVITADEAVPIAILERRDGTSDFASSDVHEIERFISVSGSMSSEFDDLRLDLGHTLLGTILNTTGTVAHSSIPVIGAPGRVVIPGGESWAMSAKQIGPPTYRWRRLRRLKGTIPVTSIDFPAESTDYTVRAKLNAITGKIEIYYGLTGTGPALPASNPFIAGTQDMANANFWRTCVDIPLLRVVTGLNGSSPGVVPYPNHGMVETSMLVSLIAGFTTGTINPTFNNVTIDGTLTANGPSTFNDVFEAFVSATINDLTCTGTVVLPAEVEIDTLRVDRITPQSGDLIEFRNSAGIDLAIIDPYHVKARILEVYNPGRTAALSLELVEEFNTGFVDKALTLTGTGTRALGTGTLLGDYLRPFTGTNVIEARSLGSNNPAMLHNLHMVAAAGVAKYNGADWILESPGAGFNVNVSGVNSLSDSRFEMYLTLPCVEHYGMAVSNYTSDLFLTAVSCHTKVEASGLDTKVVVQLMQSTAGAGAALASPSINDTVSVIVVGVVSVP